MEKEDKRFKKGDATDVLIVVISIFFLSIIFLTYWYFTTTTAAALASSPINTTNTQTGIQALSDLGTNGSSQGFVMIFGALLMGVMISSFMVKIHPVFLFLYIILLLVSIILAVFLGNAYGMITTQEPFLAGDKANPVIHAVMTNIVRITLGVGALSMIIVFAKTFGGNQGP